MSLRSLPGSHADLPKNSAMMGKLTGNGLSNSIPEPISNRNAPLNLILPVLSYIYLVLQAYHERNISNLPD